MNYLYVLIAGIAGTAIMTSYLYTISYIAKKRMKVTKILGTMLTNETSPQKGLSDSPKALLLGILGHYLIGIGFAISYLIIWKYEFLKPDFPGSILLGIISGLIGAGVWRAFHKIHPNPPIIPLKSYQFQIFLAHIIFAIATTYIYLILISFNHE